MKEVSKKKMFLFIQSIHLIYMDIVLHGKSIRSWCDGSFDRSFMMDPLSYFSATSVSNAVACVILSVWWWIKKPTLAANQKE